MSLSVDLSSYGKEIKYLYDSIVSNDPEVAWAVFNYEGSSSTLKPFEHGADGLHEFVDSFDDGKVQYGFARVIDPNSNLPKFVLVGWVGEGIPERVKGYFNAHFSTIAKYFHGYHVQITARSIDDLSVAQILKKVASASGANYSAGSRGSGALSRRPQYAQSATGASEEDWGDDAPPVADDGKVTIVKSAYKPTKVDISAIKAQAKEPSSFSSSNSSKPSTTSSKPEVVKGSYQPVGKVDIAALRSQARDNKFNPKPEPLQSSYKPVGKIDIAALRANANKKDEIEASTPKPVSKPAAAKPAPKTSFSSVDHDKKYEKKDDEEEEEEEEEEEDAAPKSVHDRMKAFGGSSASSKPSFGKSSSTTTQNHDDEDDEDSQPKSLKERMNAFQHSERLTELPKPKTKNTVASRFTPAAPRSGTAPPLPKNEFGSGSSKVVGGASRDFGSTGNKTPAQLWAEKHGKTQYSTPASSSAENKEDEDEDEHHSVNDIRSRFAKASVDDEPKPIAPSTPARSVPAPPKPVEQDDEEEDEDEDISDLKAKFVQNLNKSKEPESKPIAPAAAPSLPSRNLPPPPAPVQQEEEEEEEEPEQEEEEEDEPAPPPPPARSIPPPPAAEKEPSLPPRSVPAAPAASSEPAPSLPKRSLPPVFMAPGATPPLPGNSHASAPSLPQRDAPPTPAAAPAPTPAPEPETEEPEAEAYEAALDESELPLPAIALYSYAKDEVNELDLAEDQRVTIVGFPDELWWLARNDETGEEGVVPAEYVHLLKGIIAISEYDYSAKEDNELSFPENAVISDIQQVHEDWWLGNYNGEEGLFPAAFVKLQEQ